MFVSVIPPSANAWMIGGTSCLAANSGFRVSGMAKETGCTLRSGSPRLIDAYANARSVESGGFVTPGAGATGATRSGNGSLR